MFLEPSHKKENQNPKTGWIEVICGSMFSGKTEELIRRLNRAKIARQRIQIFKPALDKRYHDENIVSHNDNSIRSIPVQTSIEIIDLAEDCEVVGLDEAQFFDGKIVEVCTLLADSGKRVIVAGLDMDYMGKPFGSMPQLMAIAEFVTKVHAICMVCGEVASHSYRLSSSNERVLLGETDLYEARCRRCFNLGEMA
ncbi:thymidine kinase [Dyadobacter chenwenxiniae]|uniref:Thymidine kinase n=1 Tax=Dyadobacter chenwenxiniae TaxID=2906456 RepID=A0A9X1PHQ5_9BACT|nr:thymidine kinase [Dyadobacter chenwenxiniae]MCF0061552.1 thymidine kinase [Dyadobacter chenwenxiniae]UON81376.1 thymidine kinase [Dyadobacter chenwenxiniae]